jgi:hypothetical protein
LPRWKLRTCNSRSKCTPFTSWETVTNSCTGTRLCVRQEDSRPTLLLNAKKSRPSWRQTHNYTSRRWLLDTMSRHYIILLPTTGRRRFFLTSDVVRRDDCTHTTLNPFTSTPFGHVLQPFVVASRLGWSPFYTLQRLHRYVPFWQLAALQIGCRLLFGCLGLGPVLDNLCPVVHSVVYSKIMDQCQSNVHGTA